MQRGVAVAGGRGQLDRDPVDDKGCARVRLRQTESLVIERSPLRVVPDPAAGAWGWSDHVRGRVTNHQKRAASGAATQNPQRAKIPLRPDTVPLRPQRHDFRQSGPFWGVRVLTRNALRGDLPLRLIKD